LADLGEEDEAGRHAAARWALEELGLQLPASEWNLHHPEGPEPWSGEEVLTFVLPPYQEKRLQGQGAGFTPVQELNLPPEMLVRAEFARGRLAKTGAPPQGQETIDLSRRGGGVPKAKPKAKGRPGTVSPKPRPKEANREKQAQRRKQPDVRSTSPGTRNGPKREASAQRLDFPMPLPGQDPKEWNREARQMLVRGANAE
jgi:hypothetical protein